MVIFGLGVSDFIAFSALCIALATSAFSVFTFSKTYRRNRKSEQITIARKIKNDINLADTKLHKFVSKKTFPSQGSIEDKVKWMEELQYILDPLLVGVRYFTFLVEQKEIDNKGVLNYYKEQMLTILKSVQHERSQIEEKMKSNPNLAAALAIDSPSLIADIFRKLPELGLELSHYMKVWGNIRPSLKMRISHADITFYPYSQNNLSVRE